MCSTQTPPAPTAIMAPATCQATYLSGLSQAHALQEQSVAPKPLQQRHRNARELADWLQSTNTGRTLQNCTPEDLMVYLTTQWLPNHAGTTTKTGHKLPAPGSLLGVKSSLSTEFEQLGRTGPWNQATMQGNPTLSNQLQRMTKGYRADAASKGYEQRASEPIYSSKIKAMLQFLMSKQQGLASKDQLLLLRDGLIISMLWQTCFRGFNVGDIRLDNIRTPTNSPAIPFLVPQVLLQPNSQLHIHPDVTKNRKGGHSTVTISSDIMCFTTWLQLLVTSSEEARQPITNYIVRPLHKGTHTFAEKGMTSSAIWARFTSHLKAMDMYNGESVHSTRRGKMIESTFAHQASLEEVQAAAMIRTKQVAEKYIDISRPTRRKTPVELS